MGAIQDIGRLTDSNVIVCGPYRTVIFHECMLRSLISTLKYDERLIFSVLKVNITLCPGRQTQVVGREPYVGLTLN